MRIWCNAQFTGAALELLISGTRPDQLLFSKQTSASNLVSGGPDPLLAEADVAFGQPDPQNVMQSERLRWIQLTTAGYSRYDSPELRAALAGRGAALTNSSHVYADPCSQHALAFIMAQARQLPQSLEVQRTDRSWPSSERRENSRLLTGQSLLMLGFGAIGRRLAELLAPFRMSLTALRRKVSEEPRVRIVGEDSFLSVLGEADHVVNILPENPGTRNIVGSRAFSAIKAGAVFYNIGRGTTVDQPALLAALQSGRLAAAYLDVTDPEPLPPEHPLWTAPNCFITPHTAGGHDTEQFSLIRHFLGNLALFTAGEPLKDRVI
jgi:phosphoglycerate dehydrogenase-like enzyme